MNKTKVTIEDIFSLKFLEELQVSPEGKRIVCTVKEMDLGKNSYASHLWILSTDGTFQHQLTQGTHRDRSPRWHPDGKSIFFLSNRSKEGEIWQIPVDGGEAFQITDLKGIISSFQISSDGKQFLLSFAPKDEPEDKSKEPAPKATLHWIRRLSYKLDGAGYHPQNRLQIYLYDIEKKELKALTNEADFDHNFPRFSPDGKEIAFLSNQEGDHDFENNDLWLLPLSGGKAKKLTSRGPLSGFHFSPDGKTLCYIGHHGPLGSAVQENMHIYTVSREGGPAQNRMSEFPYSIMQVTLSDCSDFSPMGSPPRFSPDGKAVYFILSHEGSTRIFKTSLETGKTEGVSPAGWDVSAFQMAPDGSLFLIANHPTQPSEVISLQGEKMITISRFNQSYRESKDLQTPEKVRIPVDEGVTVDAWILKPPHFDPSQKYPAILQIHGGPHCQYGANYFHEFHMLSHAGFVVVYSNPRGSVGYGIPFATAILGQWSDPAYQDLMKVADYAGALPYVDSKRMGVSGGSYGGYMVNWIVGQTNRFKAASTQRCVSNLLSIWSSDYGYDLVMELGEPWKNMERYNKYSPITYVGNIQTPLLILHSSQDLRCPIDQAEQMYQALKWQKKEVEMVIYEGESHGLTRGGKPLHRKDHMERILKWFQKYL